MWAVQETKGDKVCLDKLGIIGVNYERERTNNFIKNTDGSNMFKICLNGGIVDDHSKLTGSLLALILMVNYHTQRLQTY